MSVSVLFSFFSSVLLHMFKFLYYACMCTHSRHLTLLLCTFQLIARLKREILSLKEELAMVTGQQRGDQLTVEEIEKYVTSVSLIIFFNSVSFESSQTLNITKIK